MPDDGALLMLKSQEERISALEHAGQKTIYMRMTESASVSALLLGLVLTFVSLHDAFVTKPETDRISRLSQFNQAVNSAAKKRQDLLQSQAQTTSPALQLALLSAATPQILNDISTARAILRDMDNKDIGIPQLIILITESFATGDMDSAKGFVERAVTKTDVTYYLRSEAKRYEGKYLFLTGKPVEAREAFESALSALGNSAESASARAFVLGDLVLFEFSYGDCQRAPKDLQELMATPRLPQVNVQTKSQIWTAVKEQLVQMQGQHCAAIQNVDTFVAN